MTQRVALAAVAAAEGAHAYSAWLPSIFTIRHFRDGQTERDIRHGELAGSIFCLGLGVAMSLLASDPLPFYFSLATVIVMVSVYEWALKT